MGGNTSIHFLSLPVPLRLRSLLACWVWVWVYLPSIGNVEATHNCHAEVVVFTLWEYRPLLLLWIIAINNVCTTLIHIGYTSHTNSCSSPHEQSIRRLCTFFQLSLIGLDWLCSCTRASFRLSCCHNFWIFWSRTDSNSTYFRIFCCNSACCHYNTSFSRSCVSLILIT